MCEELSGILISSSKTRIGPKGQEKKKNVTEKVLEFLDRDLSGRSASNLCIRTGFDTRMREISNAMESYVNSLIHGWALSNIS